MNVEQDVRMADTAVEGSWLYTEYVSKGYKQHISHAITTMQMLEQYPDFYEVDFLSLDVELHESSVLMATDFKVFKPKLICVEWRVRNSDMTEVIESFLSPFYDMAEKLHGNAFYLRKEGI